MAGFDVWIPVVYAAVFAAAALRAGESRWLWGSILLWLGFSVAGSRLLPGLWGVTHIAPLYIPHFYITLAGLFFFARRWRKLPAGNGWTAAGSGGFISLFAVSGMLMTLVFALLLAMAASYFPQGLTPYVLPAMLQMYALKPAYWFCMQAVMMAVFYLHRRLCGEAANLYSRRQLQAGVLLAMLFQTAYIVSALLAIRY